MCGRLVSAFRCGAGFISGRDPLCGVCSYVFLLFFYYFLEYTEERKPLETLIADFLVELGVIKVISYREVLEFEF